MRDTTWYLGRLLLKERMAAPDMAYAVEALFGSQELKIERR